MEILRKHLGESPEKEEGKKRMIFFVVNGNVKETTLWFVSEARCHFLQPGAVLAACWHSQESGFQPGPAVQTVCLSWLAQGHPCSEWARPSPARLPTSPAGACCRVCSLCSALALPQEWVVLARLHLLLRIKDCSVGSSSAHKGVKRKRDFKGERCHPTKPGDWLQDLSLAESRNVRFRDGFVAFFAPASLWSLSSAPLAN